MTKAAIFDMPASGAPREISETSCDRMFRDANTVTAMKIACMPTVSFIMVARLPSSPNLVSNIMNRPNASARAGTVKLSNLLPMRSISPPVKWTGTWSGMIATNAAVTATSIANRTPTAM